jgi:hypothetical protein
MLDALNMARLYERKYTNLQPDA